MAYHDDDIDDDKPAGRKKPGYTKKNAKAVLKAISDAEKDASAWEVRAKKIVDLYTRQTEDTGAMKRRYAMLWSNIEVLRNAVYTSAPQPAITRRFHDKDRVAREASEVSQRAVASIFDREDVHSTLEKVRDDYLLVGRGTAWVRYTPTFGEEDMGGDQGVVKTLKDQTISFDFVHWSDMVIPKARDWKNVPWLARKVYLTKDEGEERFGKKKWDKVVANETAKSGTLSYDKTKIKGRSCIYEVWHKRKNYVCWVSKQSDEFLDHRQPLYDLKNFFPCPRPAYATRSTDSLYPVPDYVFYQDQAEEINDLTDRISHLTDALKLTGFYPSGKDGGISDAIESALKIGGDNKMIPIESWAAFSSAGGVSKLIEWLPVDMVQDVLKGCVDLRRQLIDDVYQITGISDILRGSTEAQETLGAQKLKAQWGGIRIRSRQVELARFAKELVEITAEIVAEQFDPEILWKMTGLKYPTQAQKEEIQARMQAHEQYQQMPPPPPPDPAPTGGQAAGDMLPGDPLASPGAEPAAAPAPPPPPEPTPEEMKFADKPTQEEIIALLRDDGMRGYRIDVETDSTIESDEQAEKAHRNEFLQVVAQFMQQALPAAQAEPALVPVLGEMLMFTVRGYRAGRQLEDIIQEAVDEMTDKVKNPQAPPPPDPKMLQVQAQKELGEAKLQMEKGKLVGDLDHKAATMGMDRAKHQADIDDMAIRLQMDTAKHEAETADRAARLDIDRDKAEADLAATAAKLQLVRQQNKPPLQ